MQTLQQSAIHIVLLDLYIRVVTHTCAHFVLCKVNPHPHVYYLYACIIYMGQHIYQLFLNLPQYAHILNHF